MEPLTAGDPAEIGGYRLRARLGSGGMGRVYLAATPGGRPVAIKVVYEQLSEDENFRARFRQEIQAARRVRGLYTAELLDADPEASPPWLVTTYVAGPSLEDAVDAYGPVPPGPARHLLAGVAEALQEIHACGLVHRDLKPSNVLLSPDGPRVIDFGIVRALEGIKLTHSDINVGSPQFMAPEQIRALPATPALDIFSLGSLAAYALLGRPPFGRDNAAAVMHRVLWVPPDLDGIPAELTAIVERCLAKEPADRPSPTEIIALCQAQLAADPGGAALPWPPGPGTGPRPVLSAPSMLSAPPVVAASRTVPADPWPDLADSRPGLSAGDTVPAGKYRAEARVAAARCMYASAVLTVASVIVGFSTWPALRSLLAQQHPAATRAAVGSAAATALAVLLIRGLAAAGLWSWAGWQAGRAREGYASGPTHGPPRSWPLPVAAFVVATLGLADSYLQVLSTVPTRLVEVTAWLAGLAGLILLFGGPGRSAGQHDPAQNQAESGVRS